MLTPAQFVQDQLADGQPHAVAELKDAAGKAGLKWRSVDRAASDMEVVRGRLKGFGAGGFWSFAPTTPVAAPVRAKPPATIHAKPKAVVAYRFDPDAGGIPCRRCGCKHHYTCYTRHKAGHVLRLRECRNCQKRIITRERSG